VTTCWSLLTLTWTGTLTGLGLWIGLDQPGDRRRGLTSTLAYAPAVLLVVALALLLTRRLPRACAATWLLVGWALVVTFSGDLLHLDGWLRDLSPLEWIGKVPLDAWDRTPP
jgi:ABC-2 type transport system permease protein